MARPGPGQVFALAQQAAESWADSEYAEGVRAAMVWVFEDGGRHPLSFQSRAGLPDMKAISKAAQEAKSGAGSQPHLDNDYRRGVRECLAWIDGSSRAPRR
jgi:hypothetical protein